MRSLVLIPTLALLAGCAPVVPTAPTPQEQQRLAAALTGKVAGPTSRCLPNFRTQDMEVIGNDILFRDGPTLWRARTSGGCEAAGRTGYILVTEHFGTSDLCTGSIAKVVDSTSGMFAGSCSFEDFTPYRRP